MRGFTSQELRTFSDGVHDMYAAADVDALAGRVLELAGKLVPNDVAVFGERKPRGAFRAESFIQPCESARALARYEPAYQAHLEDHPLHNHFGATGGGGAVVLEELMPPGAWCRTGLFNEFFRPLHIENMLAIAFATPGMPFVGIGVARHGGTGGGAFSARDRFVVDLVRPHVARAYGLIEARLLAGQELRSLQADVPPDEAAPRPLTAREREVLRWVVEGKTNGQIGLILSASPRTIKKHLEHVFQKLGVETRTAAAMRAIEWKLLGA